jgi:hypothetical protein
MIAGFISRLFNAGSRTGVLAAVISFLAVCPGCTNRESDAILSPDDGVYSVPTGDGRPVMTDGIFQQGEWDDAATLVINDSVSVLFKHYRNHFFFAVDSRRLLSPSVDLFLCSDSQRIIQMHVSAQLGERELHVAPAISEDTAWVWGRTSGWYANEFRWIYRLLDSLMKIEGTGYEAAIAQAGFPHEAIEIDLLKSKVGGSKWQFRIEVWTARGGNQPMVFPSGTKRHSIKDWAVLIVD